MRPSAQPFSWKWVLFAWEWKIISTSKAEHLTSFDTEAQGNSEMAYSELKTVSKVIEMEKYFARFSNGLSVLHAHHRWPADFCAVHRCYISPGTNSRADFVRFPFHYFKKRQRIKSYKLKRKKENYKWDSVLSPINYRLVQQVHVLMDFPFQKFPSGKLNRIQRTWAFLSLRFKWRLFRRAFPSQLLNQMRNAGRKYK